MRSLRWLLVLTLLLAACSPSRADTQLGLRVPPGFEVTECADSKLANDIFCMTLDPHGRVVVSGRGYIRTLIDDDGDILVLPGDTPLLRASTVATLVLEHRLSGAACTILTAR